MKCQVRGVTYNTIRVVALDKSDLASRVGQLANTSQSITEEVLGSASALLGDANNRY